jgi:hypothetical protein
VSAYVRSLVGANIATTDHVLVLSGVCARWAYVTKEEGMPTSALSPTGERACSSTVWLGGIEKNGKDEADEVAMLQTESCGADGS